MRSYEKVQKLIKEVVDSVSSLYHYSDREDLEAEANLHYCMRRHSRSLSLQDFRKTLFNHLRNYVVEQLKNNGIIPLNNVTYEHKHPTGIDTRKVLEEAFSKVCEPNEVGIIMALSFDNLSVVEIAQLNGVNKRSVMTYISNAKANIRKSYTEQQLRELVGLTE